MFNKFLIVLCCMGFIALTGCGRVSVPKAPDNSFYPHTYFIQEHVETKTKTPEPIDEELKDTGMIIEDRY